MLPSRLVKEAYCSIEKRCKLDDKHEHTAELETEHAHIIILSHLSLRIGDGENRADAVLSRYAPRYTYGVPVPVHTFTSKVLSSEICTRLYRTCEAHAGFGIFGSGRVGWVCRILGR